MLKQSTEGKGNLQIIYKKGKIFENYASDKKVIFKIHKKLTQLNSKNNNEK